MKLFKFIAECVFLVQRKILYFFAPVNPDLREQKDILYQTSLLSIDCTRGEARPLYI